MNESEARYKIIRLIDNLLFDKISVDNTYGILDIKIENKSKTILYDVYRDTNKPHFLACYFYKKSNCLGIIKNKTKIVINFNDVDLYTISTEKIDYLKIFTILVVYSFKDNITRGELYNKTSSGNRASSGKA